MFTFDEYVQDTISGDMSAEFEYKEQKGPSIWKRKKTRIGVRYGRFIGKKVIPIPYLFSFLGLLHVP